MIVVTGASGGYGSVVVERLLARLPAEQIGVSVRDPAKVQSFEDRGVRVRTASYDDPAALREAFEGAEQVLVVSSNDRTGRAVEQHRAAIAAAAEAGASRVLYTAHQNSRPDTAFDPGRNHFATEKVLAESGIAWTSLRNGFYAHSLDWLLGPWRTSGVITVPADGAVSWTFRDDEAEGAAAILTGDRTFDGPVVLTAGEAPTFADIARIASDVVGRPIELRHLDEEEWVAERTRGGMPEGAARMLATFFQAAQAGHFAEVSPVLGELLGREPRTVRELLAAG